MLRHLGVEPGHDSAEGAPSAVSQQLSFLLKSVRRHLHRNPEVGFQEHQTSAFIREVLEMHGLTVASIAGTGLYTDIVGRSDGPAIGYRADIDALPIQDAKSVPYASTTPGVAHLCGHDAHTAIAIGVALLLHDNREQLNGRVRVFFQPNEEGMPSGAPRMIDQGVLEGLEAAYAIHVDPTLAVGRYGLLKGTITAAADQFQIIVRGPSTGHSARPHEHIDTVWIANQMMTTLYQMIGRRTDARNPAVLSICRLHGGDAFNVLPASVEIGGTLRTTRPADRVEIKEFIRETAEGIAGLHHARVDLTIHDGCPALLNDARLIAHADRTIQSHCGAQAIHWVPAPSMGSEDFAHYAQRVPAAFLRVGVSSGPETSHPLHDALFDLDESALAPTAELLCHILRAHLENRPLAA